MQMAFSIPVHSRLLRRRRLNLCKGGNPYGELQSDRSDEPKGRRGQTTTTANLGIGLAQQNKRVLLIDADAQGSLTLSLGYPKPDELPVTLADIMRNVIDDTPIPDGCGILHHGEGVDLLPANIELSGMEIRLINAMSRESVLRTYINAVKLITTISSLTVCRRSV